MTAIRGANDNGDDFAEAYKGFLDDLVGLVWHSHLVAGIGMEEVRLRANISSQTFDKLVNRETKSPHMRTVYGIVRALKLRPSFTPDDKPLGAHEINLTKHRTRKPRKAA